MSKTQDNIFDDSLKGKLAHEKSTPNNDVWSRIEANLNYKEKKQRALLWWTRGIAASVTLAIALTTLFDGSMSVMADHKVRAFTKSLDKSSLTQRASFASNEAVELNAPIEVFKVEHTNAKGSQPSEYTAKTYHNTENARVENVSRAQVEPMDLAAKSVEMMAGLLSEPELILSQTLSKTVVINSTQSNEAMDDEWLVFEDSEVERKRWQTTAAIAPVQMNAGNPLNQQVNQLTANEENYMAEANFLNSMELDYGNSYSTSIQLGYAISKRIVLNTGVSLFNVEGNMNATYALTETSTSYNTFMMPVAGPAGSSSYEMIEITEEVVQTQNSVDTATHSFRQQYVEIPLTARYQIGDKRIVGFLESGVSTRIGMNYQESVSLNSNDQITNQSSFTSAMNASQFNLLFGGGAKYKITPSWNISFMPMYRVGVNQQSNPISNANTWSFFTGLGFEF